MLLKGNTGRSYSWLAMRMSSLFVAGRNDGLKIYMQALACAAKGTNTRRIQEGYILKYEQVVCSVH